MCSLNATDKATNTWGLYTTGSIVPFKSPKECALQAICHENLFTAVCLISAHQYLPVDSQAPKILSEPFEGKMASANQNAERDVTSPAGRIDMILMLSPRLCPGMSMLTGVGVGGSGPGHSILDKHVLTILIPFFVTKMDKCNDCVN